MSTASISKSAIAMAVFLLTVAGCDASSRTESAGAGRTSPARPHALKEKHDMARARTWVLHADGVDLYDAGTNARLRSFSLPDWIWANEFHACPPDLAIAPGGDVLVSSNVVPVIWRIDAASFLVSKRELEVSENKGREVGFSRLRYLPQHRAYLAVNGLDGSLWRIDASLTRAEAVSSPEPVRMVCDAQQHALNTNF